LVVWCLVGELSLLWSSMNTIFFCGNGFCILFMGWGEQFRVPSGWVCLCSFGTSLFIMRLRRVRARSCFMGPRFLVCLFIGTVIWLLETLLVKALASSFHVNAFFDRIQEALFNQYVIETLSGPPLFERRSTKEEEGTVAEVQQVRNSGSTSPAPGELKETFLATKLQRCTTVGKKPRFSRTMPSKKDEEISIDNLQNLNQKNISA